MKDEIIKEIESANHELQDLRGTVLIFPIDGPLPEILAEYVASGSALLTRLQPLASDPEWLSVVLLSGHELMSISMCFRDLADAKKVAVLAGIDGAQYNAVFQSAASRAGLHSIPWAQIESIIETERRISQATADRGQLSEGANQLDSGFAPPDRGEVEFL